jgi:Na+-driven multidrug efflux pump
MAALGPAIAYIDCSAYLFQFMGMATTNLYTTSLSSGNDEESAKILSHSLITSILFGILLSAAQYILAGRVITGMVGDNKAIIPYAVNYARIRSFGALASIPTIVSQSAFLSQRDSVTPLKAVIVGAAVNIIGDILLVKYFNQGIGGAALATVLSQYAGIFYLSLVAWQRWQKRETSTSTPTSSETSSSVAQKAIHIPSFADIGKFLSFCGPLFFILLAKSFLWSYTTYACSTGGAADLDDHHVLYCTIDIYLPYFSSYFVF